MSPLSDSPATPNINPSSAPRARVKSRASHTKSRNGCQTCRTRRVKCDEARPVCGACSLRGSQCSFPKPSANPPRRQPPRRQVIAAEEVRSIYPDDTDTNFTIPDGSVSFDAVEGDYSASIPLRPLEFSGASRSRPSYHQEGLNMLDLRLLQHYILHLSHRMSFSPAKMIVWGKVIPEIASTNKFLMHLVLALAGLDLYSGPSSANDTNCDHPNWPYNPPRLSNSSLTPQDSEQGIPVDTESAGTNNGVDLETVINHHQQGLQGFREQLAVLSAANAEAIFAGSVLLVHFAFGSRRVSSLSESDEGNGSFEPSDWKKPQLDWIYLVRGVTSIVREHWELLRMGRMRPMFIYTNSRDAWKEFPSDLVTTPVPPRCQYSRRLSSFARGARQALSDLKACHESLGLSVSSGTYGEASTEPSMQLTQPDILHEQKSAIGIVEDNYMRIIFVLQFSNSGQARPGRVDVQADIEDALVMAWPHLLPLKFLQSMELDSEGLGVVQTFSFTILAHLYLIATLFEDLWYGEGKFERDITKINTLVRRLGNDQLESLMAWPIEVIS